MSSKRAKNMTPGERKTRKSRNKSRDSKNKKGEAKWLSEVEPKNDKSAAFSLPPKLNEKNTGQRKRVSAAEADPNSILKEERKNMHLYRRTAHEIEMEEDEVAELVEHELELQEHKRINAVVHFLQIIAAKADVFATAHTMPKHQVCIYVAFAMIPMSILTITWDLVATQVFQIPHLSTINSPGFILVINFAALPLAMYGYMMEYLMYEHSREAIIGLICVIVHPILFLTRAFMEYYFDGYRSEKKLYYENSEQGDRLEYPVGVLTSNGQLGLILV